MKKILAFFLVVVVLLGSTQLTIYADNESQGQEITTSVTNGESTKNENDSSMITQLIMNQRRQKKQLMLRILQ